MLLPILKHSNLIYHVACNECEAFYIGLTNTRLKGELNEHKPNENSAFTVLF